MTISIYDASMDPPSPRVGSPMQPTSPDKADAPPAKQQLSSAQKASLARAREKARQIFSKGNQLPIDKWVLLAASWASGYLGLDSSPD